MRNRNERKHRAVRWNDMRSLDTALEDVIESFFAHKDLAEATKANYRIAIRCYGDWIAIEQGRVAVISDIEPGTVSAYLAWRKAEVSGVSARHAWVAIRSLGGFLAEINVLHDRGDSVLRQVRPPKFKDETRRALSDEEMWRVIDCADEGEMRGRDRAIIWLLLGCGLRRQEAASLRLGDVNLSERRVHIRAATSKSVHPRDATVPIETVKELDRYILDHRRGGDDPNDPLFTDRRERPMSGVAIQQLFRRLKVRTGIRDLSAHMLRHTWATNFHRSGSGSQFDMMVEGGWTTSRMVERYTKARPFEERRRAASPFTAARRNRTSAEKRPAEKRSSGQITDLRRSRPA
jgi:site-specific recombinase XerD